MAVQVLGFGQQRPMASGRIDRLKAGGTGQVALRMMWQNGTCTINEYLLYNCLII